MAAKEHGTAYLFGVNGTVTNAKVQSCQASSSDELNAFVKNETGQDIASRHDNEIKTYDIECIVQATGFTEPDIAAIFSYAGVNTRVVTKGVNMVNVEHARLNFQVETREYLTLS